LPAIEGSSPTIENADAASKEKMIGALMTFFIKKNI
tara:strand:+ start:416 stop:523 length:108 start_codon:yes stop_codon:yes gene_type:complete